MSPSQLSLGSRFRASPTTRQSSTRPTTATRTLFTPTAGRLCRSRPPRRTRCATRSSSPRSGSPTCPTRACCGHGCSPPPATSACARSAARRRRARGASSPMATRRPRPTPPRPPLATLRLAPPTVQAVPVPAAIPTTRGPARCRAPRSAGWTPLSATSSSWPGTGWTSRSAPTCSASPATRRSSSSPAPGTSWRHPPACSWWRARTGGNARRLTRSSPAGTGGSPPRCARYCASTLTAATSAPTSGGGACAPQCCSACHRMPCGAWRRRPTPCGAPPG